MHQTTRLAINLNPLSKDPFDRANSSELKFKECYNIYPTSMPTIPQTTKNGGGNNNIFSKYNKQTTMNSQSKMISLSTVRNKTKRKMLNYMLATPIGKNHTIMTSHTRNMKMHFNSNTALNSTSSIMGNNTSRGWTRKQKDNIHKMDSDHSISTQSGLKTNCSSSRKQSVLSRLIEDQIVIHDKALTERNCNDDTKKFLKLVANISDKNKNSLLLVNELRKIKSDEPKSQNEGLPIFKTGTKLNNYLIRGFIFGKDDGTEEISMAKQKEKITKVTYELENKRRKSKFDNLVEIHNLDGAIHIDNNRKLDKKILNND